MTFFPKKILILICVIVFSCGQEKNTSLEKSETRYDKQKSLDTLNKNEALSLTKRFDALTGTDSTIKFTYQIQELVRKKDRPISFIGSINDITQQDSNFIIKIYGIFAKHKCFGEILLSFEQFTELKKQLDPNLLRDKGCFVFQPTSIKSSSMLTIDSEVIDDETDDGITSELTYDYHDVLLFLKGNLIELYLYKKLPRDAH